MPCVLIVDDEATLRESLRAELELAGYEVHEAADGIAGLEQVARFLPNVIFLDVRLPGMNGLEALRQMREIDREVGVILITGVDDAEVGRLAVELGACDYLVKPLDLTYLDRSLWYAGTGMTL